jgi:hypothetical protein
LQATPQQTVIWLAANEGRKTRTREYLQRVLNALVRLTADHKLSTLEEISHIIIEFCRPRLNFYMKELAKELPRCLNKIRLCEGD